MSIFASAVLQLAKLAFHRRAGRGLRIHEVDHPDARECGWRVTGLAGELELVSRSGPLPALVLRAGEARVEYALDGGAPTVGGRPADPLGDFEAALERLALPKRAPRAV